MAEASIGIKMADGSFYPVLKEGAPGRKRVILTTVSDNQTGAQIDLYRGNGTGISGAAYIGTLVIDEIEPAPKGNPEIELIVKLDAAGNLDAQASDHLTGEHQTLSVALDSLSDGRGFDVPSFDLEEQYQSDFGVSPAEASRLTSEHGTADFPEVDEDVRRQRRQRVMRSIAIGLLVIVIVAIVVLLALWLTKRPAQTKSTPAPTPTSLTQTALPTQAPPKSAAPEATTKPVAGTPAVKSTSVATSANTPPSGGTAAATNSTTPSSAPASASGVSSTSAAKSSGTAATAQQGKRGVAYQIRWGDTLWDLSISFYRTPWLYGKIAKANNIKNPNLIFAYSQIYIPER